VLPEVWQRNRFCVIVGIHAFPVFHVERPTRSQQLSFNGQDFQKEKYFNLRFYASRTAATVTLDEQSFTSYI